MSTWAAQFAQASSMALMSLSRSSLLCGLLGGRLQAVTLLQPSVITVGAGKGRPPVQPANVSRQQALSPLFKFLVFTFQSLPLLIAAAAVLLQGLQPLGETCGAFGVLLGELAQATGGIHVTVALLLGNLQLVFSGVQTLK